MKFRLPDDYLDSRIENTLSILFLIAGAIVYYFSPKVGSIILCVVFMGVMGVLHDRKNKLNILIWVVSNDSKLNDYQYLGIDYLLLKSPSYVTILEQLYRHFATKAGFTMIIKLIVSILAYINLYNTIMVFDITGWLKWLIIFIGFFLYIPITSKRPSEKEIDAVKPTIWFLRDKLLII